MRVCICMTHSQPLHLFLSHIVHVAVLFSVTCNNERVFVVVCVKETARVTVTSIKWENCEAALELYGSHGLTEAL